MLLSGHGGDPFSFEASHENSEPSKGRRVHLPIPHRAWGKGADATTLPVAAANIVGMGVVHTDLLAMIWDAGADAGDAVRFDWSTPGEYVRADATDVRDLKLLVKCRKFDTTGSATENGDLAITGQIVWHYAGDTALSKLTTVASAVLPAKSTTIGAFLWTTLDLGARLVAEGKTLKENATAQIILGINEAVGTALEVHVLSTCLQYRLHSALRNRSER